MVICMKLLTVTLVSEKRQSVITLWPQKSTSEAFTEMYQSIHTIGGCWVCAGTGRYLLILLFLLASDLPQRYSRPSPMLQNLLPINQVSNSSLSGWLSNHRGTSLRGMPRGPQDVSSNIQKTRTPFSNWESGGARSVPWFPRLWTRFPTHASTRPPC